MLPADIIREISLFASEVITSYIGSCYCYYAPVLDLVLCCDRFDHGSRQVTKYEITLRWQISSQQLKWTEVVLMSSVVV